MKIISLININQRIQYVACIYGIIPGVEGISLKKWSDPPKKKNLTFMEYEGNYHKER